MTLIKLVSHIFSHVWCLSSICQGYIDYKENFRWILIPGPIYRIWLIKKQFFAIFNMKYPWRLHRHQCCWNGADKTRTTNRHSHYGELAEKVGQLLFSCCDVRPRNIWVVARFDKNGSGKIAWENGKIKLFLRFGKLFPDEFLLVVALMDVVDMTAIEDSAFSTGFLVFDQVDNSNGYSAVWCESL